MSSFENLRSVSTSLFVFFTTGLICLASSGCNPGPARYPVSGTVTVDGKAPPAGAKIDVAFTPVTEGTFAMAAADPAGSFSLNSPEGEQGASEGRYAVVVTCILASSAKLGEGGEDQIGAEPIEFRQEVDIAASENNFVFDIPKPQRQRR